MNHVRFGRELGVRAVADELSHREAPPRDALVEGSVRQRALGRHEVHVGFALQPLADRPQLRDLALRDCEVVLPFQVHPARVPAVQLIELR